MRKLLNTLYITDENAYLSLEGETVVCRSEGKADLKIPFANVESIVCFSYIGCSPALMGKCAENGTSLAFFSPNGRFLARVSGKSQGNVYTRVKQQECFAENQLQLIQNTVATKLSNTRFLIERSLRDHPELENREQIESFSKSLKESAETVFQENDVEIIRGIEGACAKKYFDVFGSLLLNKDKVFRITGRSKHPPLDAVNAVLSFLYSMMTNDIASALEGVGLDSYIGFFHALRPGRVSLACDLVEEMRCICERLVITMINLHMLDEKDFDKEITGAVYLNDDGRKKVLKAWQEKKRSTLLHPYLKEKIQYGLLPFVQANLLAKKVRNEISEYPPYLMR
ncbi:MAG: type I-C CRISPR-associated endonuclease Cas1c [Firmicutes bacterium]|nr:type I-C CRISPR-associated endonuclease Cas1c [Bacillota bacterium]